MEIMELLMEIPVVVTEKLEGMNFGITRTVDGEIFVNQRNYSIQPIEGKTHDFWRVAEEKGLIELVKNMAMDCWPDSNVTFYGEYIGPASQGNIYNLKENVVKFFDIKVDETYIDSDIFNEYISEDLRVPVLFSGGTLREFLGDKDITEASHGKSVLNNGTLREGIVIKPQREFRVDDFGRVCLKQRCPVYLANEK